MKIVVIGAGICGLTFAAAIRHLTTSPVELAIYERDVSEDDRPQGYAIGLNQDLGLMVLENLGLLGSVIEHEHSQLVSEFVIEDSQGQLLYRSNDLPEGCLIHRVQRQHLKSELRKAIGDYPIYYGHKALAYELHGDKVKISFENGQSCSADYVIAADGASSTIRQAMLGDAKQFLGLSSIQGLSMSKSKHPGLTGGYYMGIGQGASIFIYQQPEGIYYSYALATTSPNELKKKNSAALLDIVKRETRNWCDFVKDVVEHTKPPSLTSRAYFDREPIERIRQNNLWLLGDAAHLMSPFRGLGANLAMLDAYQLAQTIVTLADNPKAAYERLEQDIVQRGKEAVLSSRTFCLDYHGIQLPQ